MAKPIIFFLLFGVLCRLLRRKENIKSLSTNEKNDAVAIAIKIDKLHFLIFFTYVALPYCI
jgi:hypothetical protein